MKKKWLVFSIVFLSFCGVNAQNYQGVQSLYVNYNVANCNAELSWIAPTDYPNVKYNIYRDNIKIVSNYMLTSYIDYGAYFNPTLSHTWEVRAICPEGNEAS
jgi:hypothetical protein